MRSPVALLVIELIRNISHFRTTVNFFPKQNKEPLSCRFQSHFSTFKPSPTTPSGPFLLLLFSHSVVSDSLATPWTVAHQAPLSMGFSRQEYWSGLPFPSPGDLPDPGIKPGSPVLAGGSFTPKSQGKPPWPLRFPLTLYSVPWRL